MPAPPRKKNEEKSETLGECVHAGRSALGGSTAASRPRGPFSDQREGDAPPPAVPCDDVCLSPPLGSEGTRVSRGYECRKHAPCENPLRRTSEVRLARGKHRKARRLHVSPLSGFKMLFRIFGSLGQGWRRGRAGSRGPPDGPSPRDSAGGEALASGFILGPPDVIYKQPPGQGTR